jgi:solute carrier family 25 S-adenosylmethionine transporter 26
MTGGGAEIPFWTSLVSGACAGVAVDVSLFPLDTLKTRAQSAQGFKAAGGFRGIYKGLSTAALGSAPGAALFFVAYDQFKQFAAPLNDVNPILTQMSAASVGEICACLVRVPTENVKQKLQAGVFADARSAIAGIGGFRGFFVGYWTTVMREIPFSMIQFPIYEALKVKFDAKDPVSAALCGSVSGGIAAGLTTPIDVAKTRKMLEVRQAGSLADFKYRDKSLIEVVKVIYREEGFGRLFSGVVPRVTWISIGGFVFFGAYEGTKKLMS